MIRRIGLARRLSADYGVVGYHLGLLFLLTAPIETAPLILLLFEPVEAAAAPAYLAGAGLLLSAGVMLRWSLRTCRVRPLTYREAGPLLLAGWLIVCLVSSLPLILNEGLSFRLAFFESVSGWTTTGLSVLDMERALRTTLLWRSLMQLAGGAGLAILMLSVMTGHPGPVLSGSEGREQLVPEVKRSAKLVLTMYTAYAVVGIVALRLTGLDLFDAVNHAFAAVSTGGFSTRAAGVGHWDSSAVEAVLIPLMILGNLNFVIAWTLFQGRLGSVARQGEVRLFLILVLPAALFLTALVRSLYPALGKAFRIGLFESVSALTTTGFSTVAYTDWGAAPLLLLVLLMIVGGGTCSTAGGLKQQRVYLLAKEVGWQIRRGLLPRRSIDRPRSWDGERWARVLPGTIAPLAAFTVLYLGTLAAGTLVYTLCGYELQESLFDFASALGTVGLSVGLTGPALHPAALWTATAGMLLGRLEFFLVLTAVWRLTRDAAVLVTDRHGRYHS